MLWLTRHLGLVLVLVLVLVVALVLVLVLILVRVLVLVPVPALVLFLVLVLVLITVLALVLVVAMILIGGLTRLTDSGLSITEWKPVTGAVPPLSDAAWQVHSGTDGFYVCLFQRTAA